MLGKTSPLALGRVTFPGVRLSARVPGSPRCSQGPPRSFDLDTCREDRLQGCVVLPWAALLVLRSTRHPDGLCAGTDLFLPRRRAVRLASCGRSLLSPGAAPPVSSRHSRHKSQLPTGSGASPRGPAKAGRCASREARRLCVNVLLLRAGTVALSIPTRPARLPSSHIPAEPGGPQVRTPRGFQSPRGGAETPPLLTPRGFPSRTRWGTRPRNQGAPGWWAACGRHTSRGAAASRCEVASSRACGRLCEHSRPLSSALLVRLSL